MMASMGKDPGMTKWLVLAAGLFLFFNGSMARTYGFESRNPAIYCWHMDYIDLRSCFTNPVWPQIVVWGTTLLGAALIIGCFLYGRRRPG
jgi:hypothetical protein